MRGCEKMPKILQNCSRCMVAEGPIWDDINERLIYLDILGKCVFIYDYERRLSERIDVGQQIGCMALCKNGDLLCAMEDGIYRMDKNRNMTPAHQPFKIKGRRFNDGKAGPDGCFYLGTTDDNNNGAFYRLRDGVLEELFDGCGCSNGLDWSADRKRMFYCDTRKQKIEVFDFDCENTSLKNRRTIVGIPEGMGNPDGFTTDADDNIWLALWDGGAVLKIDSSTGEISKKIEVPARKASCCCFAGRQLDDLIITTASIRDENDFPLSGYLFRVKTGTKGKKTFRYKY